VLRFTRPPDKWWQKPLANVQGRSIPAEVAVLKGELRADESGAWLNSRGTRSGVVDLVPTAREEFKTQRVPLPEHAAAVLESLLTETGLSKGVPDLIIWSSRTQSVRFVEVKCPHWDRPTREQSVFLQAASARGIESRIVEWEFLPTDG